MGLCRYLRVRERNLCVLVFAACLCAVTREVEIKELWDCLEDMSLSNLLLPLPNLYSELLTLLGVVDDVRRAHARAGANRRCRGARSLDIESRTVLHKLQGLQSMVTFCDSDLGQDFTVLFQWITNHEWHFKIYWTSNGCVQGSIGQKSINYSFSFQDPLRHEIANLAHSSQTNAGVQKIVLGFMVTNIVPRFPHLALDPADCPDWGGEHDEDEGDGDEGEEDHLEGEGQTLALLAVVKRVKTEVIVIIAAI